MVTPLELPALTYVSDADVYLKRFQHGDAEAGGAGQIAEWTDPHWRMSFDFSGFPTLQARDVWRNFKHNLEGMKVPALVYDPNRRVPLDYYDGAGKPLATGSPWGNPTVADYDYSASTFDLAGYTPLQQLYAGDYISFQDSINRWHLHALTEDQQVDGAGAVTVPVTPRPARDLVHGNAAVRMRNACCTMVLNFPPEAFKFGADNGVPFTLTGHQVFRTFL